MRRGEDEFRNKLQYVVVLLHTFELRVYNMLFVIAFIADKYRELKQQTKYITSDEF